MLGYIDYGSDCVDLRSNFLTTPAPSLEPHVQHSSFGIHDMDTQALGHEWLTKQTIS